MSEKIIRKWSEAFKKADWETVGSLYTNDTVSSDPTGVTFTGIEANLANDKTWRKTFSDFNFDFGEFIQSGNTCAVEMKITATMTGEMEMPDGTKIEPTGKTHTMVGVQILESENGKVKNQRIYADMVSMMTGFGVMPS